MTFDITIEYLFMYYDWLSRFFVLIFSIVGAENACWLQHKADFKPPIFANWLAKCKMLNS